MKRVYILLVLLVGCFVGGKYFYDHRTEFHFYHLMLLKFRGDVALKRTNATYNSKFIPEKHILFNNENNNKKNLYPTWAFRLSHSVPTYPVPPVDDTDNDGIPEVYLGSYSKKLYVLDGRMANYFGIGSFLLESLVVVLLSLRIWTMTLRKKLLLAHTRVCQFEFMLFTPHRQSQRTVA